MKVIFWALVAVFVAVVVAGVLIVYSGTYNVSALSPRDGLIDRLAAATMDHSVEKHASGISVPDLQDSSLIDIGFDHYKEMCVACHGSPAGGRSEAGMGLNPAAPELSEAIGDWKAAEIYWIVKNGVKMTGMPAFAPTHSEHELWAIVAFLEKLKQMTPQEYRAFQAARSRPENQKQGEESGESHIDHRDH